MKKRTKILIIILFILLVVFKGYIFSNKYIEDKYVSNAYVYIESLKSVSQTSVKYNVKLGEVNTKKSGQTKIVFKDKFILKIYLNEEPKKEDCENYTNFKNGDVIKINGKIQIPEYMNNPGEFNYKYYLYSNNIYGEILVNKVIEKVEYTLSIKEKIVNYIQMYKEYMNTKLDENMNKKYSSIAKSIIYGDTIDITEEIKQDFDKAGVSHMMAVSGSNIIGLTTIIVMLFNICKINKRIGKVLSIIAIIAYVISTGSSLSTLRAGIMCIISILNDLKTENGGKKNKSIVNLLLTCSIISFYAPFSIYNTGFILSFLATLGIILFNSYCVEFKEKLLNKIKNKVVKYILDVLLANLFITLSVQLLILPVQINSFNSVSLTNVLSNMFCQVISSWVTVIGSIYLFISYIPILSNILIFILNIAIIFLIFCIDVFKSLAIEITVMDLNIFCIITYYIIVFLVYVKMYLKKIYCKEHLDLKKCTMLQIILGIFFVGICTFSNVYYKYIDSFVCFFNVGQGEMSLVKAKENIVIVDIGSLNTTLAYNTISNYFKMKNISYVDAIILSHMHSDHINGLENFVKEYTAKKIIYAKPFCITNEYLKFLEIVDKYNLNIVEVRSGDKLNIGEIYVEILNPDSNEIISKDYENNINANSLVCKISFKDKDILYMADATKETEAVLIEKYAKDKKVFNDIEILKVGHHGSKTSTSEEYIKLIKPEYAVMSAKKRYYNHPHKNVIEVLNKYNIQIYITENIGYVEFNLYNL